MTEELTLKLGLIAVFGVASQWAAWRFRIPAILPLLLVGLIVGPGTGYIDPDDMFGDLLLPIVSLSVAVILFEGGLTLKFRELPAIGSVVPNLITVGIAITFGVGAFAAWLLFDMDAAVAVTLGAILTVTGPTVIGPLLDHVRPTGSVRPILKWEGIISDPVGAMFTVLAFQAVSSDGLNTALSEAATGVVVTVLAGVVLGVIGAGVLVFALRRYWIPDYLQVPVTLMILLAVHAVANESQEEAGLFAATVMGVALANQNYASMRHIVEFKENVRVLLIAVLFVVLSARLERSDIADVGWQAIAFLAVLMLLVRPLAVAVSTLRSPLSSRERVFLAAMAPRGIVAAAVSSVIALRLEERGHRGAELVVPVTFAVIIGTISIYGLLAAPLARRLKLSDRDPQGLLMIGAQPWSRALAKVLQSQGVRVLLVDSNWRNATRARGDGLSCLHASVISDGAADELDLSGIGRLLAVTSNDGVNTLASQRLTPIFGRSNVYQLEPSDDLPGVRGDIAREARGRTLFGEGITYSAIEHEFSNGAAFKATRLSKEFDYRAYQATYAQGMIPMFVIDGSGHLAIKEQAAGTVPAGSVVVSLVREPIASAARQRLTRELI